MKEFREQINDLNNNPGKRIWQYFDENLKAEIIRHTDDKEFYGEEKFINKLGTILKQKDFYDEKYFKSININNELKKLLEGDRDKLSETKTIILNSQLIEAAYPDWIFKFGQINNPATVFRSIRFQSDAFFIRARFYGDTALENVNFKKDANFTDTEFKPAWDDNDPRFLLSYANFTNLIIRFDQLSNPEYLVTDNNERIKSFVDIELDREEKERNEKNPEYLKISETKDDEKLQPLSQVMAGLEATFRKENKLDDANKAYYYKKIAELEERTKDKTLHGAIHQGALGVVLWGWSSGYGTKFWSRIVLVYAGFLALFALIYWKWGIFYRTKSDDDSSFRLRLVVFPWQDYTLRQAQGERY